jgi:hypothetical protein
MDQRHYPAQLVHVFSWSGPITIRQHFPAVKQF